MPPGIEGYSGLERIARGGFGIVYRAHQDRFDRVVAVKVLTVVDLTERDQQRFDRECRAMGALSWHPNVVAVYDSGTTDDGHPYLSMEFLAAGSLADRLHAHGPLPWPAVAQAGVQVSSALGAAHAEGTMHRDLKPENVLVGPFGEAKLGDFGIAAVSGSTQTTTGSASMTVAHVPPEILAGERPDERSDVYSLASTLHTLLTGHPPFSTGNEEPLPTVITRILHTPAPRVQGVPDELADVLEEALAKDPGARPQSAEELGRRLQAAQIAGGVPVTDLRLAPMGDASGPVPDPGSTGDTEATIAGLSSVAAAAATAEPVPAEPVPPRSDETVSIPVSTTSTAPEVVPVPEAGTSGADAPIAAHGSSDASSDAPAPTGPAPGPAPSGPPTSGVAPSGPPPSGPPPDEVPPASTGRGGSKTRGVLVGVLLLAVLVVAGAVVFGLLSQSNDDGGQDAGSSGQPGVTGTAVAGVTAPSVVASVALDPNPVGLAASDDSLWVTHTVPDGTVTRIDPSTNAVSATIPVGGTPRGIDVGAGAVWVANFDDGTVSRIDPATNEVTDTFDAGDSPRGLAANDDAVWVTNFDAGTVTRLDPNDGSIVATVTVGAQPLRVSAESDAVWVTNNGDGTVTHIDPATNEVVSTVPVGAKPHSVVFTDSEVFVTSAEDGTISIISRETDEVTHTIALTPGLGGLAVTGNVLWVANATEGTVNRVDLDGGELVASVATGSNATDVGLFDDAVWVTNTGDDDLARVEPVTG